MRKIYPLLLGIVFSGSLISQDVPDDQFQEIINVQCPACIDSAGNLLPPADSLEELGIGTTQGLESLEGIQLMTGLIRINFTGFGSLDTIHFLPPNLEEFFIADEYSIQFIATDVPASLREFHVGGTALIETPDLSHTNLELFIASSAFQLIKIGCLPDNIDPQNVIINNTPVLEVRGDTLPCDSENHNAVAFDIYLDEDLDNVKDSSEPYIEDKAELFVNNTSIPIYSYPTKDGPFLLYYLPGDSLHFSVELNDPTNYTVPFTDTLITSTGQNEYRYLSIPIRPKTFPHEIEAFDVTLNQDFEGTVRSNFTFSNTVMDTTTVYARFLLPDDEVEEFLQTSHSIFETVSDHEIILKIEDVAPASQTMIEVKTDFNVFFRTSYPYSVEIYNDPDLTDLLATDEADIERFVAEDPNSINVYPDSIYYSELHNPNVLTYTVQFENIGQGAAYSVFIEDTLPADLEASTFEILAASDSITEYQLYDLPNDRHRLYLAFEGIELPPASSDQNTGYVTYSLHLEDSAKFVGNSIDNKASIIFDFNEAIATNTAKTDLICDEALGDASEYITAIIQPTCPEIPNGTIQLQVDSSSSYNFSYFWKDGMQDSLRKNLGEGTYQVMVSEENNGLCGSDTLFFTIDSRAQIPYTLNWEKADCVGDSVEVVIESSMENVQGTGSYLFANSGAYQHILTGEHCQRTVSFTLDSSLWPKPIAVDSSITDEGNSATISLDIKGGTAPYTVQWENGQTGPEMTVLSSGTYSATITDANGCTAEISVDVEHPTAANDLHHSFEIYPNPVESGTQLLIRSKHMNSGFTVKLFDVSGHLVEQADYGRSEESVDFPLPEQHRGFYILEIKAGGNRLRAPLMILK